MEQMLGTRATRKEQALWMLEELVPGTGVNNLSVAFRVAGRLSRTRFLEAVGHLLHRHEILRTVFRIEAQGMMRQVVPIGEIDLSLEVGDSRPWLTAFLARPFQPEGELLVRAAVVEEPDGELYCLAIHHAIFDGLSAALLLNELVALYDGLAAAVAPAPAVLPAWEEPPADARSAEYWRAKLAGFRAAELDLWCEKPEASQTTLVGDIVNWELTPAAAAAARKMQRELRAPESVVLMAAYGVLLAAHGAGPDLTMGSPVSVRTPEAGMAIGYHINVLTLRTQIDWAESFRTYTRQTRRTFMEAMAHADYPVDELLELVAREGWRNNLFRHTFNYIPADLGGEFALDGMRAEPVVVENGASKFDLEFFVTATPESIKIRAAFCVDVLDRADVELLLARYDDMLVTLAEHPDRPLGETSVWCYQDRAAIEMANATERSVTPATVLEMIAGRVSRAPEEDVVAVLDGDRAIGLRRLWAAAEATRDRLAAAGVGTGDVVALLARRGPELAAAVIGVWLAGAAYLPLEPDHPEQRLDYQLDDSGAAVVLAGEGIVVPGERTVLPLVPVDSVRPVTGKVAAAFAITPSDCAYLIYTSGSTGLPKGTLIDHHSLANLVAHFARQLAAGPDDTVLWLTTFSFDISALELFLPLTAGARLAVAPDDARTQGEPLAEALQRYDVSIVQATPTTWRLVIDQVAPLLAGRRVLCGGEPMPDVLARRLTTTGCELYNVYGPTETTIWSTAGRIDPAHVRVDVGVPIANTKVYVADPSGRPLPIGTRGELCISGDGLAIGYHRRPELTSERFGTHAWYGRFYRTGDLAQWTLDGRLEILGRLDRQIKLRGNRIELAEVEGALLTHPDVRAAAVVVVGDPSADAVLWAFVVAPDNPEVTSQLWEHASSSLPFAATPQEYVTLDSFPMTGNDKVDYPALRRLATELRSVAVGATQELTDSSGDELVDTLVGLWKAMLSRGDLGPDSHFFAMGGHSLLAVQLLQEIKRATQIRLKLKDVFEEPTPAGLARRLRAAG
ncbi:non-ribosomal peptide synthetase [Nonomuraea soli]|uniref:Amino acid adenylation domain-containing protein n=1 Tax=Nonomuraea soli TaxID=1032476 RepID=A0A7W0CMF7_9ACTN|nr:non-ribosomal peptide synthetase [Nonomuraea soli]MBA2893791.1 amino acid adenylation domain-containing protein [Nonomuraea soli]